MRTLLLSILAALFLLHAEEFDLDKLDQAELRGFQTNGETLTTQGNSTRRIHWRIQGESAHVQKPDYLLKNLRMTLEEEKGNQYVIESPICLYNQNARQIRGDGAISLTSSQGLKITGVGYDFYWVGENNGLQLVLRDAVHIEFDMAELQHFEKQKKHSKEHTDP